jgi:hypothetical protein
LKFAVVAPQLNLGPLCGTAHYERDDLLGNVLRIPVEGGSAGEPDILLAEKDWNGLITEDSQYGCDYCVMLLPESN